MMKGAFEKMQFLSFLLFWIKGLMVTFDFSAIGQLF